jgi:hypothetical protein
VFDNACKPLLQIIDQIKSEARLWSSARRSLQSVGRSFRCLVLLLNVFFWPGQVTFNFVTMTVL